MNRLVGGAYGQFAIGMVCLVDGCPSHYLGIVLRVDRELLLHLIVRTDLVHRVHSLVTIGALA